MGGFQIYSDKEKCQFCENVADIRLFESIDGRLGDKDLSICRDCCGSNRDPQKARDNWVDWMRSTASIPKGNAVCIGWKQCDPDRLPFGRTTRKCTGIFERGNDPEMRAYCSYDCFMNHGLGEYCKTVTDAELAGE